MSRWFTIEKLDAQTWAFSEDGHWEKPHSYLLLGNNKAALIDTGLGVQSIKAESEKLTNLPIQVIITHAHWDHIGGVADFNEVAIHENDRRWLEFGLPIDDSVIRANFAKLPTTKPLPLDFDIKSYTTPKVKPQNTIKNGEIIDLGGRKLEIIHTPGHSPGSICIFDMERGYLFTGDTLYKGTLYMNYPSTDPVKFAKSINMLHSIPNIKRILPGHNDLNLETSILDEAKSAFGILKKRRLLVHGSGLHKFKNINILI